MVTKTKSKAKSAAKTTNKKLPSFFSFANRQFVILLVLVVAVVGVGSWQVYRTNAATDGKSNFPSITQCDNFKPRLSEGVQNQSGCVKAVQHFLNLGGYNAGPVDGKFGPQTKQAVVAYQRDNGKFPSGVVDHHTWASFTYQCNNPAYAQQLLSACYY